MLDKPFELKMDKTPTLVYVQKENVGVGELYLNGKILHGLQEVVIEATTKDEVTTAPCTLRLKIIPEFLSRIMTE
jgi:hypothetical protein